MGDSSGSWHYGGKIRIIKGEVIMSNFKVWAKAAAVRAIKTVAQTAVAMIGSSAIFTEVDWLMVLSGSLLAGVLSVLTSVAGLPEVKGAAE